MPANLKLMSDAVMHMRNLIYYIRRAARQNCRLNKYII